MVTIGAKQAEKFLSAVADDKLFWVTDGSSIASLPELADMLRSMSKEAYSHHVTHERNDFASWVGDVFGDYELKKQLISARGKASAARSAGSRVKALQRILEKAKEKAETAAAQQKKAEKKAEQPPESLPELDKISANMAELLQREKEIEIRESKILSMEEKIEGELQRAAHEPKFLNKDFAQGILVGVLASLILGLTFIRFIQ